MSLNKENIVNLIQQPNTISAEHIAPLRQLLDEYPFSSTLHLLYLKGLKNTKDFGYDKQLTQASIHVPNRERLYQVIVQEELRQSIEDSLKEDNPLAPEEKPEKKQQEPQEQEHRSAIKPIEIEPTEDKKTREKPQEISEKATETHQQVDALEATILNEIASYKVQNLTPKAKEEEKPQNKQAEKQPFTSWLNIGKADQSNDIIDKFIAENPSITPNKSDVYSAPNIAKMSLADNDGFVTETLARVYMKQGHFDKAIKTYEKLSLKIPEKSAFFASQIEVIKELKKQQQ